MRHKWLVLLLLGVMGAASVAGVWRAASPPVAPFLAPCAFDAQIADAGKERREVAYPVAESSANWRAVVGQQLMERGWTPSDPAFLRRRGQSTSALHHSGSAMSWSARSWTAGRAKHASR